MGSRPRYALHTEPSLLDIRISLSVVTADCLSNPIPFFAYSTTCLTLSYQSAVNAEVQQELTLVPMSGQGAIVMEQMLMNVPRGNGPRIRDPPGVVLGDQVVAGILHLDSSSFILNDAAKGGAVTLAGVIANITRGGGAHLRWRHSQHHQATPSINVLHSCCNLDKRVATCVAPGRCDFLYNLAFEGGAIYQDAGSVTITDCFFRSNMAMAEGGAILLNVTEKDPLVVPQLIQVSLPLLNVTKSDPREVPRSVQVLRRRRASADPQEQSQFARLRTVIEGKAKTRNADSDCAPVLVDATMLLSLQPHRTTKRFHALQRCSSHTSLSARQNALTHRPILMLYHASLSWVPAGYSLALECV
eukprot:905931-Prorocentrum_minimum.AAC.8